MSTQPFSVRLDVQDIAKLDAIAQTMDRSRNYLIQEAVREYLIYDAEFRAAVQEGMEQADRGEGIDHDTLFDRLEEEVQRMIASRQ